MHSIKALLCSIVLSLVVFSCQHRTNSLTNAREKISGNNYLSYVETSYYPLPETDIINKKIVKTAISYTDDDTSRFSFLKSIDTEDFTDTDVIYLNDELKVIDHLKKTVRTLLPEEGDTTNQFIQTVKSNMSSQWSPQTLLAQEWRNEYDTLINNQTLKGFYKIVREYEYEGQKGRIEHHIFINTENSLLERSERRNIRDDSLQQRITRVYTDYELNQKGRKLNYRLPESYASVYGEELDVEPLKVGDKAPEFVATTIDGARVDLKDFKGGKVLLNFSVTNCGYCLQALNRFNSKDFAITDEIPILYITPEDSAERMRTFMKSKNIPFPVIADAEEIREMYKLNSYPRFFMIDEQGIIEEIQIGYSEQFIDKLRS